jgi:muramidase (phage lysozyme)
MSPNLKAFLDMIAKSELGSAILANSDNGYNVLVGSTPEQVNTFDSYETHPNQKIYIPRLNLWSTAAGRYQLLSRYYEPYKTVLGLKGFWPEDQDAIAVQQIKERHGLDPIENGNIPLAIDRVHNIWASLPGAGYGQHENRLAALLDAYEDAGGKFA